MALVQASRERGVPLVIPNAGNVAATRELCAPTVFRASFQQRQPAYGMGLALGKQGVKRAAWITWDYAAGNEAARASAKGCAPAAARWCANSSCPSRKPTSSRCWRRCRGST
jgi:branched-chain amino acid transport system substrate-binding protein